MSKEQNENIYALKVIFYPILGLFICALIISNLFDIPFFNIPKVDTGINSSGTINNSGDQTIITGTSDVFTTGSAIIDTGNIDTGDVVIQEIDNVYAILKNGIPTKDYSIIALPKQNISTTNANNDVETYLFNNIKSLYIPGDISEGYLYVKLHRPLKYMPTIGVYQPLILKTNIYVNNRGVYGRLDTTKTLPVYLDHQEFLYNLSSVPVKTKSHTETNRLQMKGKRLDIGGYVSDTKGNYIEQIVFIRLR